MHESIIAPPPMINICGDGEELSGRLSVLFVCLNTVNFQVCGARDGLEWF